VISIEFGLLCRLGKHASMGPLLIYANIIDLIHLLHLINNNRLGIIAIGLYFISSVLGCVPQAHNPPILIFHMHKLSDLITY
jgi:hypothetical protein